MKPQSILHIAQPPFFSFQECLWFLDRNYDDCLHHIEPDAVIKYVILDDFAVLLRVSEIDEYLQIEIFQNTGALENQIIAFVRDWFDLDRDLKEFYELCAQDIVLKKLAQAYNGLRLMGIPNMYECLIWSVIGQQINLKFAYTLKKRLVEAVGSKVDLNGITLFAFPKPNHILSLTTDTLKKMQFSKQKAQYILEISAIMDKNNYSKDSILALSDTPTMVKKLCELKGVGVWTANYVLMKSLKRMDCITYGDAGLLNAFQKIFQLPHKPDSTMLDNFFNQYPAWKSYLVIYFWRTLANANPKN